MKIPEFFKAILMVLLIVSLNSCKPGSKFYKQKLIKTDQAFSEYSKEHGVEEAFLKYLAEDAIILKEKSLPVKGLTNIKELYDKSDYSQIQLTWEPLDAFVSGAGDLGYTYGIYTLKTGGREILGTYLSIWRIGQDGEYELVLDTGNEGISN